MFRPFAERRCEDLPLPFHVEGTKLAIDASSAWNGRERKSEYIAYTHDRYMACIRPRQLDRYVLTLYANEKVVLT